tara:strand:- start:340 stop:1002 length:663 start_codon:yes stop_codon:yes gene_type:complete
MDETSSKPTGKPKQSSRRPRLLNDDERRLWRAVAKDVRPLSSGQIIPEPEQATEPDKDAKIKVVAIPKPMASVPRPRRKSELLAAHQASSAEPPPLTGLDRRTSQKLARGQIETEARMDLHGLRQDEAEAALYGFLARSRHAGLRCVLVITGKGESPFARHTLHSSRYHEASDHSGVLRSALPQWLGTPRFRSEIAGFQPAHPRHGGGGAFYVWLRKRRA